MPKTNFECYACDIYGRLIEDFFPTEERVPQYRNLELSVEELINQMEGNGIEKISPTIRDERTISIDSYFNNRPYIRRG